MSSTCVTSLQVCALRVSKLTAAGAPSPGASNGYATDQIQSLELSIVLKDGASLELENGCGELAATYEGPDTIKSLDLSMNLCQLDSYLLEILTGVSLFTASGNAIGFQYPAVGASPDPVCIETWTKAWTSAGTQAIPAYLSGSAAYMHWVFPFNKWTMGTVSQQNDLQVIPVTAVGSENTSITVNGPYDDWPAEVAAAGGVTRIAGWFYDADLPTGIDTCDYVEVTSAAS